MSVGGAVIAQRANFAQNYFQSRLRTGSIVESLNEREKTFCGLKRNFWQEVELLCYKWMSSKTMSNFTNIIIFAVISNSWSTIKSDWNGYLQSRLSLCASFAQALKINNE